MVLKSPIEITLSFYFLTHCIAQKFLCLYLGWNEDK